MVAFLTSLVAVVAIGVLIVAYGRRRPIGTPLSWGEAMVGAVVSFFWMFLAFGVVPHQWLTYAGNELNWRPDKILVGPELPFSGNEGAVEYFLPFTVNYENLSHIGATLIYGLYLGMHVAAWSIWQNRAKQAEVPALTSEYGRPLVKQG